MRFDFVCLFPEMCREVLRSGVIGRAVDSGVARVVISDVRRFAGDRHGTVDDSPYGGGAGMIVRAEPSEAIRAAARANGMRFLVDDGIDKIRAGATTVEEVTRVVGRRG